MSLDDAMSTVSNAQHADLEKAKRNRSKKYWSIRTSRESRKMGKLMASMIKTFKENTKHKTQLSLLQEDALRMKYEKNQLTHEINEFLSHNQQMEHLMRMWIQQMEHEIRMKDSLIKTLSSLVNRLQKTTGEVVVQAGMNPQYYGGSAQQQQLQLSQAQQQCPHPPQLQHIKMQQEAAQAHTRMQQQQQQTVPAQMMMQLQSQMQVMMRPQGLGQIPPSCQNVASGSSGGEATTGEGGGDHAPGQGS